MSIASFLEKTVIGDKNIKRDANRLMDSGNAEYARGTGIENEGLDRVRGGITDIEGMIRSGRPLPASVYRAYDLAHGRVGSDTARTIDASAATLAQQRRANPFLSAEAAQEYQHQSETAAHDREFDTNASIDEAQASAELSQYNSLFERLDSLRGTILNAGQFIKQLGQQRAVQGLLTRVDRAKAISSAGTSATNTAVATYGKSG